MDMQAAFEIADPSPDTPSELLTWAQIAARYPDQWVILIDMVKEPCANSGGRVVAHGPTRDAVKQARHDAIRLHGHLGQYWTGELGSPVRTWMRRAHRDG